MQEVMKYSGCFVCGDRNEHGLQARFYYDGEQAITEVDAGRRFEGYPGIYHGGIIATLLDEVMIKAILAVGSFVVTAEMTIRFLAPVRTGDKIRLTGRITHTKGRVFHTEGMATGEQGQVFATATARYVKAGDKLKAELMSSLQ